jgi:Ca2+-binding RTX toxin-like protein
MNPMQLGRRGATPRGALVLAPIAALALCAIPAQAATVAYPAGGSTFDADAQGWVGSETSCSILTGAGLLCDATNVHDPDGGNPGGALATNVNVTANAGGLFRGTGTWTSPAFTVDGPVANVTFQYDRLFDAGGLARLSPASDIVVQLVDQEGGAAATLLTDSLGEGDATFAPRGVGLSAATVATGHTYRLAIRVTTTASDESIAVLGQSSTRFDNVRLLVSDTVAGGGGTAGGGGSGPSVSAGVTIVKDSLSAAAIRELMRHLSENVEVGTGPGGSAIPLADCTIVGTPGVDRILGTRGNDVICGLGGNDVIVGGGGRDAIDGANGHDRLNGSGGGDLLLGLRGNDRLRGHGGRDRAGGGAGRDRVLGGRGNDLMRGGGGRDRVLGGPGKDRLPARDGKRDLLNGGTGRDRATVDRHDRVRRIERVRRG